MAAEGLFPSTPAFGSGSVSRVTTLGADPLEIIAAHRSKTLAIVPA